MMRLFLRIFYMTFLWIILLANLFIVFDLTSLAANPMTGNNPLDLSNSYFGVSTMINALKNIEDLPIGQFSSSIGDFQKNLYNTAYNLFHSMNWSNVAVAYSSSFFDAILEVVKNIGMFIGSIFVWMGAFVMTIFYYVLMLFSMVWTILGLANGYYITPVPDSHVLDGAFAISNFVTPLFSAV